MKFIEKHRFFLLFLLILVTAVGLRFYQLGTVPHGMTWDEAAIGYNGFAVIHTRRDEWLQKVPISFRSFGDYKSPLAIYVNGFSTLFFGMTLFAVRLPFAIAGVGTVVGFGVLGYVLFQTIFEKKVVKDIGFGMFFLAAVSPWLIHFSRVGFESGIALCFSVWSVNFLLLFLQGTTAFAFSEAAISKTNSVDSELLNGKSDLRHLFFLFASMFTAVCSLYTYHSAKIVMIPLLLSVGVLFFAQLKKQWKPVLIAAFVAFVLLLPLAKDAFFGAGNSRFSQSTVFTAGKPLSQAMSELASHFVEQFSPAFLFFGKTTTLRHGDGVWGVLFLTDGLLILVSVVASLLWILSYFISNNKLKSVLDRSFVSKLFKVILFGAFWVFLGSIPAIIGSDVPHSNRALLAYPGFAILIVTGFVILLRFVNQLKINVKLNGSKNEKNLLAKSVGGVFVLTHLFFVLSYVHNYYTFFAAKSADDFQDGFIEAFQFAVKNEATSDQIIITNQYGQPYIYALFVRKTDPIWYQGGSMIKYLYLPKISEGDLARKNTVIIAAPSQIPPEKGTEVVYGSDHKVKFVLVKTP